MTRRLLVPLVMFVLASAFVGRAIASAPGTGYVFSHNWQGITYLSGLETCPLFGATPYPWYVLRNVDLTDQISSTYTPSTDPLWQIDSVGTVHGVINAPDGRYTVAGGAFKEHRIGDLAPWYFSGTGLATISGPGAP